MKFVVSSKPLYAVLSGVSKVINSKNALAILNNFLFSLEGNMLTITASDTENAISGTIEVSDVEGEGSFCIDARRINDLMREISEQPVTFLVDDETYETTLTLPSGEYKMVVLPGDQFPQYQREATDEEPKTFTCTCAQLANGIEKTVFAVGTDDYHPQMMGIFLDIKPEGITFVATDTRKLVRYIDNTCAPGIEASVILPAKPAQVLRSVLTKEGECQVVMTSKSATFSFDSYTFNCRFIKGRYPDYNRVIPTNNPYQVLVDRLLLLTMVRRVGVFVDPGYGMEKFRITSDHIDIKSSDAGVQSAGNESLACDYSGPEIIIGFSAPYMIDIANVISTEKMIIRLSDPSRPGVFSPTENEENTDLLMLLMPMNVNEF